MAVRIEFILILVLLIVFGFIFFSKTENIKAVKSTSTSELLFENFSLVELNESGVSHQIISSQALKDKKFFTLSDINITYNQTQHLYATEARYEEDIIHLKDDVILRRDDGIFFSSEHLKYSVNKKKLHIDSNFSLDINGSIIIGENLNYLLDNKSISADKISARIILTK
ncbi:MAG: LPS export ABC transporter periplasmic protein LptC [Sulfurovaceae bacterium]|nr:LPS export ABC transporter periplasmic protein LptC [Sulfurovaceae bacterium]